MTGIHYTSPNGDVLCGGQRFDVMSLGDSIVIVFFVRTTDGNELPCAGVQNVNVGTDGRAPLSIETREMMDTTSVVVSTVFDRFRNMRLNSFGLDYVSQSVPIIHHISVSTVDERGCVHTSSLITGSLEETSCSRAICSPGSFFVTGYVGLSSTIAPLNHAYLCLNVTDGVVRPEIVPFTNTSLGTTYEGDDHRENTHHTGGLFQHNEVFPTTPMSDTSSLGTRSMRQSSIKGGKIYMPPTPDPHVFIQQLLTNSHFMKHIRAYNQMFAMTSFGAKVDDSVNNGKGPYVFKVSGQIYHWIGSLFPKEGHHPRFLQLYIYDTQAEVSNIIQNFRGREEDTLNPDIVEGLIHVLAEHNGSVRLFRTARDRYNAGEIPGFKIRLYNKGGARGYELLNSDVLGGIVFEDGPKSRTDFDVIIEFRGGLHQRINKLHQSYMSLQFPLLFVFGEPRFYPELLLKSKNSRGRGQKVTMNAYYRFQLHPRVKGFDLIFKGLYDAISQGDREGIQAGSMVDPSNKIKDATQIDDYISAELPDLVEDPIAYKVVTELMMHGPCGVANPSAVCTEKWICNKGFPKMYNDKTFFDINGHTHYRRRQTEFYFMKGESRLDNCNVVPYNRMLCLVFRARINVEYCGWSMLIKYLFKYISKGPDRILGKIDRQVGNPSSSMVEKHIQVDEIKTYVDGHFIFPFGACWRIFDYPIYRREPVVQILNVHLENIQRVNFRERDRLDVIVNMPDKKKTTLTEWYGMRIQKAGT
ncbi:hypothetical protein Tco_0795474 [Tanacetum coccineum]